MEEVDIYKKNEVLNWIIDSKIVAINEKTSINDIYTIFKNGVLFVEIINFFNGKNKIINGINKTNFDKREIYFNYNKLFQYLRTIERFNSKYLWVKYDEIYDNPLTFWKFLIELYTFYVKEKKKYLNKKLINSIIENSNELSEEKIINKLDTSIESWLKSIGIRTSLLRNNIILFDDPYRNGLLFFSILKTIFSIDYYDNLIKQHPKNINDCIHNFRICFNILKKYINSNITKQFLDENQFLMGKYKVFNKLFNFLKEYSENKVEKTQNNFIDYKILDKEYSTNYTNNFNNEILNNKYDNDSFTSLNKIKNFLKLIGFSKFIPKINFNKKKLKIFRDG